MPSAKNNYITGKGLCQSKNATLPIVSSASKNFYMTTIAGRDSTWIGYSDQVQEGTWMWENKMKSNYTNWDFLQPDGQRFENCAVIDTKSSNRHWHDKNCGENHKVVCEKGIAKCVVYLALFL